MPNDTQKLLSFLIAIVSIVWWSLYIVAMTSPNKDLKAGLLIVLGFSLAFALIGICIDAVRKNMQ